jgi:transcriptional regulator NrdR family protein
MAKSQYQKEAENAYLKCPSCGSYTTKVVDSRSTKIGRRRRRECLDCEFRFTTEEVPSSYIGDLERENKNLQEIKSLILKIQVVVK